MGQSSHDRQQAGAHQASPAHHIILLLLLSVLQASKVAIISALTDASATVFNHQCAAAHSRMKTMTNALHDSLDEVFESYSSKCANAAGSLTPVTVNALDEVQKSLSSNKPVTAAIAEALQDAVQCGCKPGNCFWCAATDASNKNTSTTTVSAFDLGNNITGQFQQPLNWNQMVTGSGFSRKLAQWLGL
jgi:ElaB/YqjD/DUF883 family membrane-anchored ribosome-binding protein